MASATTEAPKPKPRCVLCWSNQRLLCLRRMRHRPGRICTPSEYEDSTMLWAALLALFCLLPIATVRTAYVSLSLWFDSTRASAFGLGASAKSSRWSHRECSCPDFRGVGYLCKVLRPHGLGFIGVLRMPRRWCRD